MQGGRDNFVEGLLVASQTAFSEKSDAIADNPLLGKIAVGGVVRVRVQPLFRIGKRLGRGIDLLEVVIEKIDIFPGDTRFCWIDPILVGQ